MQNLQKINSTSSITTYRAKNSQTVQDVLKNLNLETKYFAILVNGKKSDISREINKNDEIVILPKISGG